MAEKESAPLNEIKKADAEKTLVFFPNVGLGTGLGHCRRVCRLIERLGKNCFLYIEEGLLEKRPEFEKVLRSLPLEKIIRTFNAIPPGSLAVIDYRETPPSFLAELSKTMPVIGIDEGGRSRECFHYLVDTLPRLKGKGVPNIQVPPFSLEQESAHPLIFPFRKILISFGGEDQADLSHTLLDALLGHELFRKEQLTVVEGPLFKNTVWPKGVTVVRNCSSIAEIAGAYDLLLTHYGLTVFEALENGVPVILLNPSRYHRKLSRKNRLPEIGVQRPLLGRLKKLLADRALFERLLISFTKRTDKAKTLYDVIAGLAPPGISACPVCAARGTRALARFPQKTYFQCRECGVVWLVSWAGRRSYSENYFTEEYRAQYGKTYLEDFENIKMMGKRRLGIIKWILTRRRRQSASLAWGSLLDIGTAYGPFLAAAREQGFSPQGFEMSKEGVAYIRDVLKIPCLEGNFERDAIGVWFREKSFDIITMWYVIEHFERLREVLIRVNMLLRQGGIFALATPSGSGISRKKSKARFLEASPADHVTIWSPRMVKGALARFGFHVRAVRVTGHHPERFFKNGIGKGRLIRLLSPFLILVSRLMKLGDTFEVYAEKIRDCP